MRGISRTIIGAAAFALLITAFVSLWMELESIQSRPTPPSQQFARLERGDVRLGLSTFSQKLLMLDCLQSINGIYGKAQPTKRRRSMLKHCHAQSRTLTDWQPSFGLGWIVAAHASKELGQPERFEFELTLSQRVSPNEQWLAQLRLELSEIERDALNAKTQESLDRDIVMMTHSVTGMAYLAELYVQRPTFRARLADLMETLPDDVQRRFVSSVQQNANALPDRN